MHPKRHIASLLDGNEDSLFQFGPALSDNSGSLYHLQHSHFLDLGIGDENTFPVTALDLHDSHLLSKHHMAAFTDVGLSAKSSGAKPGGGTGGGGTGGVLTTYTSGSSLVDDHNEFNINIVFSGTWTAKQQAVVTWAANLLSSIIDGDVRDDTDLNGHFVDDVVINVSTGRIDGSGNIFTGNVLAQTQITAVRDAGTVQEWLPVTSTMKLDSTDLKSSTWSATWDDIVLHEMTHALGFAGVIFDGLKLLDASGNFIGANARLAYGGAVPVEKSGGIGTAGSHWDETAFAPQGQHMSNELMTGYVAANEKTYVSDTTVGALADLGYVVHDPSPGASYYTVDSGLLVV
jgi:hypothetical protein